ncbi:universal stress protein [soil metagenome]
MSTHGFIKPIVVGVEDGQSAALTYALRDAELLGADLTIVHAFSIAVPMGGEYLTNSVDDSMETSGRVLLGEAVAQAHKFIAATGSSMGVESVLECGTPSRVLEEQTSKARELVIGPADAPWYERAFTGNTSKHLLHHATCPVVIVPESWRESADRERPIVVTVDGDSEAQGPLGYAFDMASKRGVDLQVLHIVPVATTAFDIEAHRANVAEVVAGWCENYPDVQVTPWFSSGVTDQECIRATSRAALVVVGRPHTQTRPFALTRSTAVAILKAADCPVAVIPTQYNG